MQKSQQRQQKQQQQLILQEYLDINTEKFRQTKLVNSKYHLCL